MTYFSAGIQKSRAAAEFDILILVLILTSLEVKKQVVWALKLNIDTGFASFIFCLKGR